MFHKKQDKNKTTEGRGTRSRDAEALVTDGLAGIIQRAELAPHTLSPRDVMVLQRTIGNQATSRKLHITQSTTKRSIIQREFTYSDEIIIKNGVIGYDTIDDIGKSKGTSLGPGGEYQVYEIDTQNDKKVYQIFSNDSGSMYWVDGDALETDQDAEGGASTEFEVKGEELYVFTGDPAGSRITLNQGMSFRLSGIEKEHESATYLQANYKGHVIWIKQSDFDQDQVSEGLDTADAPTQAYYPPGFETFYGQAGPSPLNIVNPMYGVIDDRHLVLAASPTEEPEVNITVMPSGQYLWGKASVARGELLGHKLVPNASNGHFFNVLNWDKIPDGEYWVYEDYDNAFTEGAEAEHEGDFHIAFNATFKEIEKLLFRTGDTFDVTQPVGEQLAPLLPPHLLPPALNETQGVDEALDVVMEHAKIIWEKLVQHSGFKRDIEPIIEGKPSHGTRGYMAEMTDDGHIKMTRVTNDLLGPFDPQTYIDEALK